MIRTVIVLLFVFVTLGAWAGSSSAGGPGGGYVGVVTGQVTLVNRTQNLLELNDGSLLWAPDVRQLEGLRDGMKVQVRFEDNSGRKRIISVEKLDK